MHSGEHCNECGMPIVFFTRSYWLADDALWKKVMSHDNSTILCPPCFATRAHEVGVFIHWEAVESERRVEMHPDAFASIGAATDTKAEFRELLTGELLTSDSFSDYFRFSLTKRMDRDEALALARKIEVFVGELTHGDTRVYVGVKNPPALGNRYG